MGKKDKAKERSNGQNKWLRYCLRGVLIFVLVALCISGFSIYREYSRPPEEVIIRALAQTLASPSYLFHSESSRTIDGQTEKLCEVWGEKNEESTHLVGTVDVVDSKFEIYQIKNQFYRQDAISKEWLVINEVSEEATEKLLQEIDPLAVFRFDQNIEAEYLGKEKIGSTNCRKYHIMAYCENAYLNLDWHDFFYTVWVDKDGYLRQAEIIAANKDHDDQKLAMTVQFEQSKSYLEIEAPVQ